MKHENKKVKASDLLKKMEQRKDNQGGKMYTIRQKRKHVYIDGGSKINDAFIENKKCRRTSTNDRLKSKKVRR